MSRSYDYDDDEDWPNQADLWWANAMRALKGKRGRKALTELREALLMLPEKRLVAGAISTVALQVEADNLPDEMLRGQQIPNHTKIAALDKCARAGMGVCAVGAYLLRRRVLESGETAEEAMRALPSAADVDGYTLADTANIGKAAGLTFHLAYLLADRNDEIYSDCTPEERYGKFLAWIDSELTSVTTPQKEKAG